MDLKSTDFNDLSGQLLTNDTHNAGSQMSDGNGRKSYLCDNFSGDMASADISPSTPITSPRLDENGRMTSTDFDNIWSPPTSPRAEQSPDGENKAMFKQDEDGGSESLAELGASKYELRPQTREFRSGFTSTWIDQDKTGDFDPSEEFRQARLHRNQAKLRRREFSKLTTKVFRRSEAKDALQPKTIPTLSVKVSIASEAGKATFAQLTDRLPNEPKPAHNGFCNGYRLRKRSHTAAFQYDENCNAEKLRADLDLPNDLTGHPLARGCWECLAIGNHKCSLLCDEHTWPCVTCVEDENDCELITVTTRKRACERCKRRRTVCSYSYTLNHRETCQQCSEDGHRCIAGPTKEAIRHRISYDRDWKNDPLPRQKVLKLRKDTTCKECGEAGLVCSLSDTMSNDQACKTCVTAGDPCTLESLVPQHRTKENGTKKDIAAANVTKTSVKVRSPEQHRSTKPSRTVSSTQQQTSTKPTKESKGTTKTIETRFSHPIVFNHEDNTSGEKPCHFCSEPGFALLGLEAKEAEVIEWADGWSLEEISGGHRGDGVENTRMCAECTLSRLPVILCARHEMRPICGGGKDALDMNAAFAELFFWTGG